MTDDEIDHRELADHRVEHRRDRVRAVAGMDQHHDVVLGADLHRRAQPVQRAVGPVGVHVGLELDHLEAEPLHVVFHRVHAVLHAAARVVDVAANEALRVLLHHLARVAHVHVDGLCAAALAVGVRVDGVALRRLDESLVDAARLAVEGERTVHHADQAFARERVAVMPPGQVDQVRRIATGVDDH
ncbi:hypothetical protein D3C86_1471060 [compost metagenome]